MCANAARAMHNSTSYDAAHDDLVFTLSNCAAVLSVERLPFNWRLDITVNRRLPTGAAATLNTHTQFSNSSLEWLSKIQNFPKQIFV